MLHLRPIDETTWDRALTTFTSATLFHTSAWLNVLIRSFGVHVDYLGICEGDAIRGLLPLMRRRRGPFMLMGSPIGGMATPYLGPLVPQQLLEETFALLEPIVQRARVASMQLSFPGPVQLSTPPAHYRLDQRVTLVLPLAGRTHDELWQGLKKNCRAHVRQATKRGVEVFEADSPSILDDYFRLERQVYARRQRPVPFPRRFFVQMWDTLRPLGAMNVFAARHDQRIVGVQINGWYGGKLYGLFGATDWTSRQIYPGNLLEWHLIEWASARGLESYDMIDGMDTGWSEFKRSFGASAMPTPVLLSERSRAATLVRQTRQTLRHMTARVGATLPRAAALTHLTSAPVTQADADTSAMVDS